MVISERQEKREIRVDTKAAAAVLAVIPCNGVASGYLEDRPKQGRVIFKQCEEDGRLTKTM